MRFQVRCFFLFHFTASIFFPYNSCLAMEEETQRETAETKELLKQKAQESGYTEFPRPTWDLSIQTPGASSHEEAPRNGNNKCGTLLCNNKAAIFMFILLGGATVVAYYYYSLLNDQCQTMKGACNSAVGEVSSIVQNIDQIQHIAESLYNFTTNCPNARSELLEQVVTFLQNCCSEQP